MIRCNFAILLAEQNLKITKVSNDTGISRTTLTALSNNYSQGIQFDTINKLCIYLRVTPEELLAFVPIDIKIDDIPLDINEIIRSKSSTSEILVTITDKNKDYNCYVCGNISIEFSKDKGKSNEIVDIILDMELWNPDDNEHIRNDIEEENQILINAFKQLTRPFLNDLEAVIIEKLIYELEYEYGCEYKFVVADDAGISINWPNELLNK